MIEVCYPTEDFMSGTLRRALNFTMAFLAEHSDPKWWERQQHYFDPDFDPETSFVEFDPSMQGISFA